MKLKYILVLIVIFLPLVAMADFDPFGIGGAWGLPGGAEGESSVAGTVISVINIVLSFLGIITLVIVLWGGFIYLFARGNMEQAAKGKKVIYTGILGIAIVMASYGISFLVFSSISDITSDQAGNPTNQEGWGCKQKGGICMSGCATEFFLGKEDCPEGFSYCCRDSATSCTSQGGICTYQDGCSTTWSDKLDCIAGKKCCMP